MTRLHEIIYPIFLEASQYTSDEYWRYLIEELAYGNCPYGTYIDSEQYTIISILKHKTGQFYFSEHNGKELYPLLYDFFHNTLGFHSYQEYIQHHQDLKQIHNVIYSSWSDIKKKTIKDLLIENYVIELKHRYSLTVHQMKMLLSNIIIWFQFKILSNKDVLYDSETCKILQINDLYLTSSGHIKLKRDLSNLVNVNGVDEPIIPIPSILNLWIQYIVK